MIDEQGRYRGKAVLKNTLTGLRERGKTFEIEVAPKTDREREIYKQEGFMLHVVDQGFAVPYPNLEGIENDWRELECRFQMILDKKTAIPRSCELCALGSPCKRGLSDPYVPKPLKGEKFKLKAHIYVVKDYFGNVEARVVDEPSDTVQIWGEDKDSVRQTFESDAYHMGRWAADHGFEFAVVEREIEVQL